MVKRFSNSYLIKKKAEYDKYKADVMRTARACRRFVKDKKHKQFLDLFNEFVIPFKEYERDNLRRNVKDNDEYLRKSLILETEIATIKMILNTPEEWIDKENEILDEERKRKEAKHG